MSIEGTVAKIRVKTCVLRILNRFYGIGRSFFSTLEVNCFDSRYCCQDTGINVCSPDFKMVL